MTNSADGFGEEPLEENSPFNAFGHEQLPTASIGFAFASPVLELTEGERKVTLFLTIFSPENISISDEELQQSFQIYASGEEDWLGPFTLNEESSISKTNDRSGTYLLKLQFEIANDEDAIVNYNDEVLTGGFNSQSPMVRIGFKFGNLAIYFFAARKYNLIKTKNRNRG